MQPHEYTRFLGIAFANETGESKLKSPPWMCSLLCCFRTFGLHFQLFCVLTENQDSKNGTKPLQEIVF